jgi:hypothetical protein
MHPKSNAPQPQLDENLCAALELLMDGTAAHSYASLAAAYRSALADYRRTGDEGMRELAIEAERELRKLLASLREKACGGQDFFPA